MTDLNWLEHVKVNHTPLQRANQDEILTEYTVGGPDSSKDIRMVLSVKDLEHLLQVAKDGMSQRVVLRKCGMTIQIRRSQNKQHIYQVMKLISLPPKPEYIIFT